MSPRRRMRAPRASGCGSLALQRMRRSVPTPRARQSYGAPARCGGAPAPMLPVTMFTRLSLSPPVGDAVARACAARDTRQHACASAAILCADTAALYVMRRARRVMLRHDVAQTDRLISPSSFTIISPLRHDASAPRTRASRYRHQLLPCRHIPRFFAGYDSSAADTVSLAISDCRAPPDYLRARRRAGSGAANQFSLFTSFYCRFRVFSFSYADAAISYWLVLIRFH